MTVPELLVRPLLVLFPHGGQHRSRRNAYQAVCLAEAHRRDHVVAAAALAAAASPPLSRSLSAVR